MFIRRALATSVVLPRLTSRSRWFASYSKPTLLRTESEHLQRHVWQASISERTPNPGLQQAYRCFFDALAELPDKDRRVFLSEARGTLQPDLKDALRLFIVSGVSGEDLKLIFIEITAKYELLSHDDALAVILRALAETDNTRGMRRWLTTHGSPVLLIHWRIYLFHLAVNIRHKGSLAEALDAMPSTGCLPTSQFFISTLQEIFELPSGALNAAINFLEVVRSRQTVHDHNIRALVAAEAAKLRVPADVARLLTAYPASSTTRNRDGSNVEHALAISEAFHKSNRVTCAEVYSRRRAEGFQPTPDLLTVILRDDYTASDIAFFQNLMQIRADPIVWAKMLERLAIKREGRHLPVLTAFDQARAMDVDPSFALAEILVRTLCAAEVEEPLPEDIHRAYGIYLDVYNWYCRDLSEDNEHSWEPVLPSGQETVAAQAIYHTLFRTFAHANNWRFAWRLLKHQRKLRIPISHATLAEYTTLLIRIAPDWSYLREVYLAARSFEEPRLGIQECTMILRAILSREEENSNTLPWRDYLWIVRRMLTDGVPLTSSVYEDLLNAITAAGSRAQNTLKDVPDVYAHPEEIYELLTATRTVQQSLTVNVGSGASKPTTNALMSTFAALGAVSDVLQVWQRAVLSRRVNSETARIALEVCNTFGHTNTGLLIVQDVRKLKIVLDRPCWYAVLECLCQGGKLDDAARLLCTEMGRGADKVKPDEKAARIVLEYAKAEGLAEPMRERIQRFLPSLYAELPHDILDSNIEDPIKQADTFATRTIKSTEPDSEPAVNVQPDPALHFTPE